MIFVPVHLALERISNSSEKFSRHPPPEFQVNVLHYKYQGLDSHKLDCKAPMNKSEMKPDVWNIS